MTRIRCFNIQCIHNKKERCVKEFIIISSLNQQCSAFFEEKRDEQNMEEETNKNIRGCNMYELCLNHQFCISCEDKVYFTKYVIVQED